MSVAWATMALTTCLVAALILRTDAVRAGQAPSILLTLPGSFEPMGFLARKDGSVPDEAAAGRDRIACLLDPKTVPTAEIRRLLRMAKADRAQAYRATTKAVSACMDRKGWTTEVCGGPDGPICDLSDRMAEDDPEAFE